jgi:hypothetical protein
MSTVKVRFCVLASSILGSVLACPAPAAANPLPIPSLHAIYSAEGIALLFATNFFVNLLLFAFFLLAVLKHGGRNIGKINQDRRQFYALILLSGGIITMVGSVVDAALLYKTGSLMMWLFFDPLKWSVAALLIYLSIFAVTWGILRVTPVLSLLPAGAMTGLNWFMWSFLFGYGIPELCVPILVFVATLTLLFFRELGAWHRAEYPDKKDMESDVAAHPK